jgi:hypothetical protein
VGEFTFLLHVSVEVIDFFTLTSISNSFLYAGVEAGDEAHLDSRDLSDQEAALKGVRKGYT